MRRELMSLAVSVVLLVALTLSLFSVYRVESDYTSRASVAYRSNTGSGLNTPKSRDWTGMFWTSESQLATAGSPVRWVRTAYCPNDTRFYERTVVTLSDDGYLDAYVRKSDGTWSVTNNIGNVGTTANAYRAFDIAYEKTTGRALLVYGVLSTDTTKDLAYKIWDGVSWSLEAYVDDAGHAVDIQYYWVSLSSKPTSGSNEIAMITLDNTDSDINGWIWSGSAWGNYVELAGTASTNTRECLAVAYESTSGKAWTAYGIGNTVGFRRWSGATWETAITPIDVGALVNWLSLKPDPASNKLMLVSMDGGADLNIIYWNESAWTLNAGGFAEDAASETAASRCADFEWELTGSKGLLVYGDSNTDPITYQTFNAATPSWGTRSPYAASGVTDQQWVQMRVDPRGVGSAKIYVGVLDDAFDITLLYWDGAAFGGEIDISDSTVATYECFEIEFQPVWKQTPIIFVDPATQSVLGIFYVRVDITWAYNLYSWEFNMTYDTAILTANTVTEGALLASGGTTYFNKTINDANGWVYAYGTLQGNVPGVTGSGTLATIKFASQAVGASSLDLHDTKLVEYDFVSQTTTLYPPNKRNEVDGSVTVLSVIRVGDINLDGWVDGDDLALLNLAYGSKPGDGNWNSAADLNGSGLIDIYDLRLLGKGWYPPP